MNVLFLSEDYFPYLGGVPVVVQYLAEGLSKNHSVHVATSVPSDDGNLPTDIVNGVIVHRFKIYRNVAKRLKGDLIGFQDFIKKMKFDVIIVECGQASTTDAFLPILSQIEAPCIIHAHGLSGLRLIPLSVKSDLKHTIGNTYNWLRMQWYYKYKFKKACRFFAASISLTKVDSGYSYLSENIAKNFILGNAAEDFFFQDSCVSYEWNLRGKPYLLSIANFSVVKDQIGMMREFYRTIDSGYSLVMIGSKKNDYYYKMRKEKQLLDQKFGFRPVEILVGVNRCFFPSILDGASAYLVTSICEEYSISVIEAMARAVPFISTNVGNAMELPGGVVVDNIGEIHTAIDSLLSDELKRMQLGYLGRQYAFEKCRRKVAIEKLESILLDIQKSYHN